MALPQYEAVVVRAKMLDEALGGNSGREVIIDHDHKCILGWYELGPDLLLQILLQVWHSRFKPQDEGDALFSKQQFRVGSYTFGGYKNLAHPQECAGVVADVVRAGDACVRQCIPKQEIVAIQLLQL